MAGREARRTAGVEETFFRRNFFDLGVSKLAGFTLLLFSAPLRGIPQPDICRRVQEVVELITGK